jgi:hypothetical protein
LCVLLDEGAEKAYTCMIDKSTRPGRDGNAGMISFRADRPGRSQEAVGLSAKSALVEDNTPV